MAAAQLARIQGLRRYPSAPHIQWEGAYLDDYKVHPFARNVDAARPTALIGAQIF